MLNRWWSFPLLLVVSTFLVGVILVAFAAVIVYPTLPSLEALTDYQPKIPLRIVSAPKATCSANSARNGARSFAIRQVPDVMKHAILAAEDERFYQHGGVDYFERRCAPPWPIRVRRRSRAPTITMQVARNFFLTREKTVTRKLREVLLAWKIEASLRKDEILELYVNQIFSRSARLRLRRGLADLLRQAARQAARSPRPRCSPACPRRPRRTTRSPTRTREDAPACTCCDACTSLIHERRRTARAKQESQTIAVQARQHADFGVHAEFVAEMARQVVYERTATTPTRAASPSRRPSAGRPGRRLRRRAQGRDRLRPAPRLSRARGFVKLPATPPSRKRCSTTRLPGASGQRQPADRRRAPGDARNGKAIAAVAKRSDRRRGAALVRRALAGRQGARRTSASAAARSSVCSATTRGSWQITQMPQAEAAFVSLRSRRRRDPRADRRLRLRPQQVQPRHAGAAPARLGFKPFIYSAALEKGFTPATIINDAPFFVPARQTGGEAWEPKNYDGKFEGPMRLRDGARQVEEPRHGARAAGDRAAVCAGLHHALRLRSRSCIRPI